jgi:hypothetical protein
MSLVRIVFSVVSFSTKSSCFVGEHVGVIITLETLASSGDEMIGFRMKLSCSVKYGASFGSLLFCNKPKGYKKTLATIKDKPH